MFRTPPPPYPHPIVIDLTTPEPTGDLNANSSPSPGPTAETIDLTSSPSTVSSPPTLNRALTTLFSPERSMSPQDSPTFTHAFGTGTESELETSDCSTSTASTPTSNPAGSPRTGTITCRSTVISEPSVLYHPSLRAPVETTETYSLNRPPATISWREYDQHIQETMSSSTTESPHSQTPTLRRRMTTRRRMSSSSNRSPSPHGVGKTWKR